MTAFFDTNILVYAVSNDIVRRDIAQTKLIPGGAISVQVLNELANVLRKKQRRDWREIEATLAVMERWFETVLPLTIPLHKTAIALARDHTLTVYDALIVAAALEAGRDRLYSEDMQHGRRFGDCEIVNPFTPPDR